MYISSETEDSDDDIGEEPFTCFELPRRFRPDSFYDSVVYDPRRHQAPMHVSDLLRRFKAYEGNEDGGAGRVSSGLSLPSASSRRSLIVSPGLSRGGTGRGTRLRFPIEVDVKGQDQWDELMTKEGLLVIDAYAGWCGPCKAIESTFRRIRNETGDDLLHFITAETDSIETLALYREKSKPTFLFYGGGQLVNVIRGCNAPLIVSTITDLLKEEHKILNGESERKPFVDVEVQRQEIIPEEKQDEEKLPENEEDEEDIGDVFAKFNQPKSGSVVVEVPKEISVAIIKPDALKNGHADEIIRNIEESGIEILHKEEKILSKEEAAEFYKQHEGSDHFEQLIDFMSSGPVLTLVLSKKGDDAGYGLIPELRDMIGPKDVNVAKEQAPDSIRAQYGTDAIMNAVHACDSSESAARELAFFFPDFNVPKVQEKQKKKRIQRTLALIRPDAYMKRKVSILNKVQESGFQIAMSKEMYLSREQAEEFYADHKDEDYFESLINNMTSGPSLALCLAREDAVESWRSVLGPKDVAEAKAVAPDSFRAVFADEDATINPIHGAETPEAAEKELQKFFPLQSTVAVIKPEAYSIPEESEQIVKTIQEAGFKISAQKEINLTKDLAAQFYKEHEGKEFFDGLTDYMSSGPTLFMILSREDAIPGFRALVGPNDPDKAREECPNSLRALFATDSMKNAVHSSSDVEKATKTIQEFFPEVELNPDGTVREPPKKVRSKHGSESGKEDSASAEGDQAPEDGENGGAEQQGEGVQEAGDQLDGDQQQGDQQGDQQEGDQQSDQQEGDQQEGTGEEGAQQTQGEGTSEKVEENSNENPSQTGEVGTEENKDDVNNNEVKDAKQEDGGQGEGEATETSEKNQSNTEVVAGEATSNDNGENVENPSGDTQNESQSSTSVNENDNDGNKVGDANKESEPAANETETETAEAGKTNETEEAPTENETNSNNTAQETAAGQEQSVITDGSPEDTKTEGDKPE